MKKALPYILYSLVILAAAGLLVYQFLTGKGPESRDITRCILIIAGALTGMLRSRHRRTPGNKKALYQKAYGEFIQNAFFDSPKLEKKFYRAVDDYNLGRPAAAVAKLSDLRKECQRTADIYAVTVFTALCYDDMRAYEDAVKYYEDASRIREHTTLQSNVGMCYMRLGKNEAARRAYENAIRIDPHNANAYNNLATLYFRTADYHDALEYAELALRENENMPQALGCAAVCSALLGNQEEYQSYYRRAVAAGYEGQKIRNAVASLSAGL